MAGIVNCLVDLEVGRPSSIVLNLFDVLVSPSSLRFVVLAKLNKFDGSRFLSLVGLAFSDMVMELLLVAAFLLCPVLCPTSWILLFLSVSVPACPFPRLTRNLLCLMRLACGIVGVAWCRGPKPLFWASLCAESLVPIVLWSKLRADAPCSLVTYFIGIWRREELVSASPGAMDPWISACFKTGSDVRSTMCLLSVEL